MRDYAKVSPGFWIGPTGKAIRKLGAESQVVAMYLMTGPHANMLGLYHLPLAYIVADTGLTFEGASKALARLSEVSFCTYDDDAEMIWVHEMAIYQVAESLHAADKQVKGINKEYQSLPECQQLRGFWLKYKTAFHLENARGLEGASKGLRSKEIEQEQEQEQEREQEQESAAPAKPSPVVKITKLKFDPITGKPKNVSDAMWARWCEHRAHIKKPLSENACDLIRIDLEKHHDPDSVIANSIKNGWQGLFPEKTTQPTGRSFQTPAERVAANNAASGEAWVAEMRGSNQTAIEGECSNA